MKQITIIVPCYNEQESIPEFYKRIKEVKVTDCEFHYLFINDGSQDETLSMLRTLSQQDEKVSYVSLSRNFGKEAAMLAGLDYADGDAVIIMDADLQHPPEMIPEMINWWMQGYDDVCGRRSDRHDESWIKRNFTNLYYYFLQKSSRYPVQRDVGDFRLLGKRCVAALRMLRERQRNTKGLFTWVGYRKKEISYQVQPRVAGKTTWSFWGLCNLALEGLTAFTTMPLRIASCLGIIVSVMALLYMVFVFVNALLYGDPVAGYPTLMVVMLFLGGVQLLSLGIIGEYLGRVFNESKRRPIYLAEEYNGQPIIYTPRDFADK